MCFSENFECHQALKQVSNDPKSDWEVVALAIAGGIVGGMILAEQLKH